MSNSVSSVLSTVPSASHLTVMADCSATTSVLTWTTTELYVVGETASVDLTHHLAPVAAAVAVLTPVALLKLAPAPPAVPVAAQHLLVVLSVISMSSLPLLDWLPSLVTCSRCLFKMNVEVKRECCCFFDVFINLWKKFCVFSFLWFEVYATVDVAGIGICLLLFMLILLRYELIGLIFFWHLSAVHLLFYIIFLMLCFLCVV